MGVAMDTVNKAAAIALWMGGAVGSFSGSAAAQAIGQDLVQGNRISVEVVSDQRGTLPVFRQGGRYYVPGDHGERYSLRLTNNTGQRILAVVSVDGVNIISGQNASTNQTGYVINPWQTTDIQGWRKSQQDVARFYFTSRSDSYSTRTGRPGNEGIIGVAVFDEKIRYPQPRGRAPDQEVMAESSADSVAGERGRTLSKSAPQAAPQLGTGHGEREYSYSYQTTFDRQPRVSEVLSIEYDTWTNLQRRGILPRTRYPQGPNPFPRDNGQYVPDPPRW